MPDAFEAPRPRTEAEEPKNDAHEGISTTEPNPDEDAFNKVKPNHLPTNDENRLNPDAAEAEAWYMYKTGGKERMDAMERRIANIERKANEAIAKAEANLESAKKTLSGFGSRPYAETSFASLARDQKVADVEDWVKRAQKGLDRERTYQREDAERQTGIQRERDKSEFENWVDRQTRIPAEMIRRNPDLANMPTEELIDAVADLERLNYEKSELTAQKRAYDGIAQLLPSVSQGTDRVKDIDAISNFLWVIDTDAAAELSRNLSSDTRRGDITGALNPDYQELLRRIEEVDKRRTEFAEKYGVNKPSQKAA